MVLLDFFLIDKALMLVAVEMQWGTDSCVQLCQRSCVTYTCLWDTARYQKMLQASSRCCRWEKYLQNFLLLIQ